jgi:ribosome-binding protein aMBF1 (putative translation factor)
VEGNADRDKARDVYDSLAQLGVGEGWIWAPDHNLLQRVKFPPIRTLDTSKTLKAGDARIAAPVLAKVNIAAIKDAFARIQSGHEDQPRVGEQQRGARRRVVAGKTQKKHRPAQARTNTKPAKPPRRQPRNEIAVAILHARTAAELTQMQLAERLKTDQANIARLEHGRSLPSTRTLLRIAQATGHRLTVDFVPMTRARGGRFASRKRSL